MVGMIRQARMNVGRKIYALICLSCVGLLGITFLGSREMASSLLQQKQIELKLDGVHKRALEAQKKAGRAGEEARRVLKRWADEQTEQSEHVDITIDDDGAIRVVVESGDTRVVYEFESKKEFKESEPELYERFRDALE